MPYLFTCPHCQTKTQVDDRYSGHKGQCATCGGDITVPYFTDAGAVQASATRSATAKRNKSTGLFVAAGLAVVILACIVFAAIRYGGQTVAALTENRLRSASMKNLQEIATALNAYADEFGTYPPAYTTSANGTPLHSWRVLILPYLDEVELYDQFDLSKPWSDEANMSVAYQMPGVYEHPDTNAVGYSMVPAYYYLTGPGTLFPKGKPLGPEDVKDNGSQTILVIEGRPTISSGMWTEPVDMDYGKMQGLVGGAVGIEPGGWIPGGVAMATVDGRAHFLPIGTPASTFNALVTPAGNEPLADDTLD
ncbi:hypothetical protein Pla52n_41250 [Stieleria varia]|uniref:DUF1559 domain-containing protein n=2 Tax=Stieleria varia TaxID=2528005 RepID=A0A5C6ANS6_9BACT|nr:hypothetical protein Pla52n_41250 [Stieleria varia]